MLRLAKEKTIKALVLVDGLHYTEDCDVPDVPAGEALVRVRMAGICNTDLELARGYMGFRGSSGMNSSAR